MRSRSIRVLAALAVLPLVGGATTRRAAGDVRPALSPIQHVVFVVQENHSFDNVLGRLCVSDHRCDGTTKGTTSDGRRIALRRAPDIVPDVAHDRTAQVTAINGGRMNGWNRIGGCGRGGGDACFQAYTPEQIPNLASLARRFVISDRTFANERVPSFGSHAFLLAAQLGGFDGSNPDPVRGNPKGDGWGCDSFRDAPWRPGPLAPYRSVPSCFPDPRGLGPYRSSPVPWIPTIFDRLDEGLVSWRLYAAGPGSRGYSWAGCPYFAECLYGPQHRNVRTTGTVLRDARSGELPAVSIVFPSSPNSQHNGTSMRAGDNWIGEIVDAIRRGPDWGSTAVFITYDDCGCFYDHVTPPHGWGIRQPMVIVSPYAKPGYTDSTPASFASVLAFIERNWGLPPLTAADATAYAYSNSFDFDQVPLSLPPMVRRIIPAWEHRWMAAHPVDPDDVD